MQDQIISKIEEIYPLVLGYLEKDITDREPFSLFEGKPGAALFLYEYARYRPDKREQCYDAINLLIENAFDYISNTSGVKISYCDGIIGILWLTQFLRNQGIVDMDAEEIPDEVITQISDYSLSETLQNNCDLLHGGFGFWAFLLESRDIVNKEKLIRDQLNALHAIKLETAFGCNWKIDLDIFQSERREKVSIDPLTSTHLGLAHGTSFILILLSKTLLQGYFKDEITTQIHQGLSHIRSLKNNSSSLYCYPMVVLNGKAERGGRLAWCNGDLCVAVAFWMAWKATGNVTYKADAIEILQKAVSRNTKEAGVQDAGLCHGSSGIAQIFRRFFWETQDLTYLQRSNEWLSSTVEMATFSDGLAGFKTYRSEAYGGPHAEYGFLSGISGIGMALLSFLSETPSDWDRVLLLS